MKYYFYFVIFVLFCALQVQIADAGTGAIPSGPNIKLLKDNLRFKNTDTKIMTNDSDDPTSVAKDAEIGSLYIQAGTGALFQKQDSGSSTNWLSLLIGPVGNGTDNHLTRWDGTGTPNLQDSLAILDDLGAMSGLTQLDVDNIRVDGNTISSTDTDGHLLLDANGAGNVSIQNDSLVVGSSIDNNAGAVNGTAVTGGVVSHVDNNATRAELAMSRHENTSAGIGATMYGARTRGTEVAPVVVQANDDLLNMYALGYDGTDWAQSSRIQFEVDGTPGTDDMPGRIVFRTSPDGTQTPTEAMRIDSSQNVTLSGSLLTSLTQNSVPYIGASGLLTEDNPDFTYDGNTLSLTSSGGATLTSINKSGAGDALVITRSSGSGDNIVVDGTEFVLDNAGNLGLGIVPNDTLDVVGTAQIDDLRFDTGTISTATDDLTIAPATELTSIDTNIVYNPTGLGDGMSVYANTADTADNSFYLISGGGAVDPTRGSYIGVYGNENSIYGGDINFSIGDNPASTFSFRCDGGITNCLEGDVNGKWTIGESGGTQTHQVEGDLAITGLTQNGVPYVGASDVLATDVLNFGYLAGTQNFYVNGITDLDNIQIDGNTIASSDTNGNIVLNPNGTGNVNLPDLTISQPAYIDASGNLVSQDLSLTADVSGVLPIANGGTNSSTALNNNRLMISSTGSIIEHSALTQGSVLFADANGLPAEDNTNFTWDNTAKTLGIIGDVTVDNLQLNGNLLAAVGTNQDLQLHATGTGAITMSQNPLEFTELTGTPTSGPAAGLNQLYFQNDQKLRTLDASGHVETLSTNESRQFKQYNRVADAAAAVAGDLTSNNNATFDGGGGTFQGTLAITTGALDTTDSKYYQYTMVAGSQHDYFYFTVPVDNSTDIGYRFRYSYDGADDDMDVEIKCSTSGFIYPATPVKATGGSVESMFDLNYIPSGCGDLKIGFSVATANAGKILKFNRFAVTDDPTVYGKQIEVATIMAEGNGGALIGSGVDDIDFTEVSDTHGAWNGTQYTVQHDNSIIEIHGSVYFTTSAARNFDLFLDTGGGASVYKKVADYTTQSNHQFSYTSKKGEFSKGDIISLRSSASGTLNNTSASAVHYLNINEQWESDAYITPAKSNLSDWEAYDISIVDPTTNQGTIDTANSETFYRRVGDTLEVKGYIKFSAVGTSTTPYVFSYPNLGVTVDTSKSTLGTLGGSDGTAHVYRGATPAASLHGNTSVRSNGFGIVYNLGTTTSNYGSLQPVNIGNVGNYITFFIRVPIVEWSSDAKFLAAIPVPQVAILKDVKTSGTDGGANTANTVHTRVLNTVDGDSEIVSLSSNQFTLPPGKYLIECEAVGHAVNRHQAFLYDVTNTSYVADGTSEYSGGATNVTNKSKVYTLLNLNSATTYELRHWTQTANAQGFGINSDNDPSNPQSGEVYSQVKITKYKTNRN